MRVRNWREQLGALLEERRRVPATAVNNCGLFAADVVLAETGEDVAADFRGMEWTTLAEAVGDLQAAGYTDLCAYAAAHLEECHPSRARAGDLMAFETLDTGWALGVVNGERVTVLTPRGLGTMSRMDGKRAFRVG